MYLRIILATVAVMMMIEGIFLILFESSIKKSFLEIIKKKLIVKMGMWEVVIGAIIIIIVLVTMTY